MLWSTDAKKQRVNTLKPELMGSTIHIVMIFGTRRKPFMKQPN